MAVKVADVNVQLDARRHGVADLEREPPAGPVSRNSTLSRWNCRIATASATPTHTADAPSTSG